MVNQTMGLAKASVCLWLSPRALRLFSATSAIRGFRFAGQVCGTWYPNLRTHQV